MKVLLIWPPQTALMMPCLSLPVLKAFLEKRGHHADTLDLNLAFNLRRLQPDALLALKPRILQRAAAGAVAAESTDLLDSLEATAAATPEALAGLRDPHRFYQRDVLESCFATLSRAYELISAAFWPTRLLQDLHMRYSPLRRADLLPAVQDVAENPFLEDFADAAVAPILASDAGLVGISVTFESQWLAALTLARLLKARVPDRPIVLGGGFVTRLAPRLQALGWMPPDVDFLVVGEGESALAALADQLERRPATAVTGLMVPNLCCRRDGQLQMPVQVRREDVTELPPPDFSGMPLDRYLVPEPILPLLTSRGCYWGRCAFCTHTIGYHGFRLYRTAQIAKAVRQSQERHGARLFYFVDEAVCRAAQNRLAALCRGAGQAPFCWYADVRLDAHLTPDFARQLFEGGCRMLIFGLESASQRLLDHMHKGTRVATMQNALRACHDAGIATVVMYFVGFPSETQQEALQTVAFLERNRAWIDHVAVGAFSLSQDSPVHRDPAVFGVTALLPTVEQQGDLSLTWDYSVRSGLTQTAAQRVAESLARRHGADPQFGRPTLREVAALYAARDPENPPDVAPAGPR